MHSDRCCEHYACAGVYVKQVLCASVYTFAYTVATECALVAWRGGLFLTE